MTSTLLHVPSRAVARPPSLSLAVLRRLPAAVRVPRFTPQTLRPGILHIGCGAFHRAHQAVMTQEAIEEEMPLSLTTMSPRVPRWGIVSTSLRTPTTVETLKRQSGLYSVLERRPERTDVSVVGTLSHLAYAPDEPETLRAAFAHAAIRIVTLTVSAGGYCVDPNTLRLDPALPDIRSDSTADTPRTAVGILVHGLRQRRAAGMVPPVIISCDNIPGNGRLLRQACIDFAALSDDGLAAWIATHVLFPSSVVDRIVPALSEADLTDSADALGVRDAAPVAAEPIKQWVIERFDGPRPHWEAGGARFVDDVGPWEAAKLRLLNGGHLAVAYIGLLAGFETVDQALGNRLIRSFVRRFLIDEQTPTLAPSDHDSAAYVRELERRWSNPRISDSLLRVGRNGSQKLPVRVLASLRENARAGRSTPCAELLLAAWMRCAGAVDGAGRRARPQDPLTLSLQAIGREAGTDAGRLVDAMLARKDVFGTDLASDPALRARLGAAVRALQRRGALGAVESCLAGTTT
jgi:fructuronate reductase